MTVPSDTERILARLEAIETKLDYVVERQRFTEDLIREMTPVVREAITVMSAQLADYEDRGYFAVGRELLGLADRVVTAYGPDEVHQLSEHIVAILDTVRNVTQPDVLEVANEATNVLHHADDVEPLGLMGVARASRDDDVQKGMAVALEILRHLGRAHPHDAPADRPPAPRPAAPAPSRPAKTVVELKTPPMEEVEWEGHRFSAEGFLLDPATWDEDLAAKIASAIDVVLTDEHWTVIRYARAEYESSSASANVRKLAAGSGVGTRRMYELFPRTPGKSTAMIAGIPKPVGCV